ncbi:hypothetical protein [uncultured Alistipes sp.]|uniref:hypothetical protein n=1 Tax=uncultured Alistipes sp. TaxID=538949 RepID=UPI00259834B1|nr:hypothetical protein [uncultured Alistipes sp.]
MIDFRKILFTCVGLGCISSLSAQSFEEYRRQALSDFDSYKAEEIRKFKAYRDKVNAEYAEYMRRAWSEYKALPADPVPPRPEPPKPVVKDPDTKPSNAPIPFDNILPMPAPVLPPQPVAPLPVPEKPVRPSFSFAFYGTPCTVGLEERHRFSLAGVDENKVAEAWELLSSDTYLSVVAECLSWRDRLQFCDWGYVRFLERMTTSFFGTDKPNEACLLQMYILTQSGYKVRIARADDRLVLLLPSKNNIYEYAYLHIGGCKYYVADASMRQKQFYVFDREFPKEQFFSLRIPREPLLSMRAAYARQLTAKRYLEVSANVATNRNLIDFYDDYPLTDAWNIYAEASLSASVKKQLYPVLQKAIAGKNKVAAANILIDWVQTAFDYRTDDEQFGQERPLFADETLYYPYSDCEDRAILYAILIRDLLGLDVVLLHYPEHLATAVCFGDDTSGDHLMIDGRKYIVCDPTYIGASIGETMPQYKQTRASVVRIR